MKWELRRCFRVVLVLAGLCAGPAVLSMLASREGRISAANCEKVALGMAAAQVEAILGPPGERSWKPDTAYQAWGNEECSIFIYFDDEGRVLQEPIFVDLKEPSIFHRLFRFLRP